MDPDEEWLRLLAAEMDALPLWAKLALPIPIVGERVLDWASRTGRISRTDGAFTAREYRHLSKEDPDHFPPS